jgi:hypothetical protein
LAEIAAILFESGTKLDSHEAAIAIAMQYIPQLRPQLRSKLRTQLFAMFPIVQILKISKKAFEIFAAALSRLPLKSAVTTV